MSYKDFIQDVGIPPARRVPLSLVHLDTLIELGPGNAAWMDTTHATPHIQFEKHRQLMAEINHPVPPYLAPKVFYTDHEPQSQALRVRDARLARLSKLHAENVEMQERRTKPRKEVVVDPLDTQVIYNCKLVTIRQLAKDSKVDPDKFREALLRYGDSRAALEAIRISDRRRQLNAEACQRAEQDASRLADEEERNARFRAEGAAVRERWEAGALRRQMEYDEANPRWMALKVVFAVFDGKNFETSPFEAIDEEYAQADRVLAMLKEGAHRALVKVAKGPETQNAIFGIERQGKFEWAKPGDYIIAVRAHDRYQLTAVEGVHFSTFISTLTPAS